MKREAAEWATKTRRRLRSRWQERGRAWPVRFGPSQWSYVRPDEVRAEPGWQEPVDPRELVNEVAHADAVMRRVIDDFYPRVRAQSPSLPPTPPPKSEARRQAVQLRLVGCGS